MARDDYHVIVYQILAYLYKQLKSGADVDPACLTAKSKHFEINRKYWEYIICTLLENEYIRNVVVQEFETIDGEKTLDISNLEECQITPKGIEYLTDNSFMAKAKECYKEVKSIVTLFV